MSMIRYILHIVLLTNIITSQRVVGNEVTFGIITATTDIYEQFIANKTVELATTQHQVTQVNITHVHKTLQSCTDSNTIGNLVKVIQDFNAAAVIGTCGDSCSTAISTTQYYRRLLISPGCRSVVSNKDNSHLIRTMPFARAHSTQMADIIIMLALRYQWTVYGIVFLAGQGWTEAYQNIRGKLLENYITVESFPIEAYITYDDMLRDVQEKSRIVLLLTPAETTTQILKSCYRQGITESHNYQFITTDFSMLELEHYIDSESLRGEIINGVIDIGATLSGDSNAIAYQQFVEHMNATFFERFNTDVIYGEPDHLPSVYESFSYLYDAITVYQQSIDGVIREQLQLHNESMIAWMDELSTVNSTLNSTTDNSTVVEKPQPFDSFALVHDTDLILDYIKNKSFEGLSGKIIFNELGVREPTFKIRNFYKNHSLRVLYDGKRWLSGSNQILWFGGSTQIPLSVPPCGFDLNCPKNNDTILIVAIVIPCVLLVFFIAWRLWKKQKYENDINNKISILKYEDLSATALQTLKPTVEDMLSEKGIQNDASGVINLKVYHKRKKVMYKKLHVGEIVVTKDMMAEMKYLRDLKHKNVNGFIGVTTRYPNICILYELCKKGSLYDILNNDEIQLDWVFKHAFLWDIINGMLAIHESPIKYHGHLTSKNCLINHRWVVQITDFGLEDFKRVRNQKDMYVPVDEQSKYEQLLWTAPENINFPYLKSRQGDVYSFAVIVSEVINRQGPFGAFQDMRPSDVIHYVKKRCIPPFRPHVTLQTGLDSRLVEMMKRAWHEWPENRPHFREIKSVMNNIRGEGVDILDNMIEMMERYSRDLDKTAKERTQMYRKEKVKSNELLYRCVPKPIASDLLEGLPIYPEEISSVTLLLVQIDKFTELLEWLRPQQAVDILNDFYRMCDQQVNQHKNIYKLLGDREELIFVSCLPCYKETSDAELLATLAIKIAKASAKYRWRHLGDFKLDFKMSLHSGPAHGAVVGMKVPIYTLLGKTLDYIRLLTKYTPCNVIVVTPECGELIKDNEDYFWKEIGEVEVNNDDVDDLIPKYLTGSTKLGEVFVEKKPDDITSSEEEILDSEREEVPKKPYWDVSSSVETAFQQWFKSKQLDDINEGPERIYTKNPFMKI